MADVTTNDLEALQGRVDDLTARLRDHTHNYAGASSAGGDALTVRIDEDNSSALAIAGVTARNTKRIMRNTLITAQGGELTANRFIGQLHGTADDAERLTNAFRFKVVGDVSGIVDVDGSMDVELNTTLSSSGVSAGEYGPMGNMILSIGDSFTVPQLTINQAGVVTKAVNKVITVPSNVSISGTTNATQFADPNVKLFPIVAERQAAGEPTYSERLVYVQNHRLHSNGYEVVNVNEAQQLTNKVYNGFVLAEACSRGVDDSPTGTFGSSALVTSDAFARHEHAYAKADADGAALKLSTAGLTGVGAVTAVASDGTVGTTADVTIDADGRLAANEVFAKNKLAIPGGFLWIDDQANVVDVAEYNSGLGNIYAYQVITAVDTGLGTTYNVEDLLARENRRITVLETNFATMDDNVDVLTERVASISHQVSQLGTQATAAANSVDDLRILASGMDGRLTTVEGMLTTISADVQQAMDDGSTARSLTTRVSSLEARVTSLDASAVSAADVAVLKNDVNVLKLDVSGLKSDVSSLRSTSSSTSSRVDELSTNLLTLTSRVSQTEMDITSSSTTLDRRLTALEADVASLERVTTDVIDVTLDVGERYNYDATVKFGEYVDMYRHAVIVRVLNTVDGSVTKDAYVDALGVVSVGVLAKGFFVVNMYDASVTLKIFVR